MHRTKTLQFVLLLCSCRYDVVRTGMIDGSNHGDASLPSDTISEEFSRSDGPFDTVDSTIFDGDVFVDARDATAEVTDSADSMVPLRDGAPPDGCIPTLSGRADMLWFRGEDLREARTGISLTVAGATAPIPLVPGRVGSAFDLRDFSQGNVLFPASEVPVFENTLSVEVWVNPSQGEQTVRLVDRVSPFMADGWFLDLLHGSARFAVGAAYANGDAPLPVGTWSHVAGVYDGARVVLYVNGERQVEAPARSGPVPPNTLNLRLGTDMFSGSRFRGLLDEVLLRSVVATGEELRAVFSAGSAGRCR